MSGRPIKRTLRERERAVRHSRQAQLSCELADALEEVFQVCSS